MIINDKMLSEFKARLKSRNIFPARQELYTFIGDNSLTPFIADEVKDREKLILLQIKFYGDFNERERYKSLLYKELTKCKLKFSKEELTYEGYIVDTSPGNLNHHAETMDFLINAVAYERQVVIELKNSSKVILSSTAETPVKLIIKPNENIQELELMGFGEDIKISNLTQGSNVIIDGIRGLVTEEGQNKWLDYDSWGFPKLIPGENEITFNANVTIAATYNPRWL